MDLIIRAVAEILVAVVPPIVSKLIEVCCPPAPSPSPEPEPEILAREATPVVKLRSRKNQVSAGDYIDAMWSDSKTPGMAIDKMETELALMDPPEEVYMRCKNTCKKLLQYFSMESRRKQEIQRIKDAIAAYDKDLADDIDLSLFSTCALWEGRIALYR